MDKNLLSCHSPPMSQNDPTTIRTVKESEEIDKLVDRSLEAWRHQNELLWGRLQTIAAVQVAVIGGCYFLEFNEKNSTAPFLAFLLATLGVYLSVQIQKLIKCDLDHRYHYAKLVKSHYPNFFPTREGKKAGWKRIRQISKFFVHLNFSIALITGGYCLVLLFYWIACGCWMTSR